MALASTGETFVGVGVIGKDTERYITFVGITGFPWLKIRSNEIKALALSPVRNAWPTMDENGNVAVCPVNSLLASIDEHGYIAVHDLDTGDICEANHLVNNYKTLDFSPDGRLFASSSFDGKAWLWDTLSLGFWDPPWPIHEVAS